MEIMEVKKTDATFLSEKDMETIRKKMRFNIYREEENRLFITLEDCWVKVDLEDNTYCIGIYEG